MEKIQSRKVSDYAGLESFIQSADVVKIGGYRERTKHFYQLDISFGCYKNFLKNSIDIEKIGFIWYNDFIKDEINELPSA